MLIFILFNILYSQNNYSTEQLNPNYYYCKSNFALKILKLSEQDLIFYGTEGGVLRTYDAGETWLQHYTGLNEDDDILKMIYSNKKLLGVTYSGKLITSKDKGDFWDIKKISSNLTGITKIDNDIYTATSRDSIFVTNDNGNSWLGYQTHFNYIQNITSQNEKIIAITQNKIYILNKDMTIYKELIYPFSYKKIYDKYDNLYLNDEKKIAKLNNDFEWEIYNIFEEVRDFAIYPIDNNISIFTYLKETGEAPIYQQFSFDMGNNNLEFISKYKNVNLNNTSSDLFEFKTLDIEYINDEYFLSNYYKTILKINTYKKWEILSYSHHRSFLKNISNIHNFYIGQLYGTFILHTKNNGNSFDLIPSSTFTKNLNDKIDTVYPKIEYAYELDSTKDLIIFNESNAVIDFKRSTNNHNFFGIYDKNYKTIKILDINLNFPFPTFSSPFTFLGKKNENYYMTRSFRKLGLDIPNPYSTYFYKLNSKTLLLDTIYIFEDSVQKFNFYFEDDKIWAIGINEDSKNNIKLYFSADNGKSFELKQTFKLVKKHPMFLPSNAYVSRNKNNDLIVFTDFQIEIINENNYSYSTIELDLTLSPWQYEFSEKYFEDIIFSWSEIIDSVYQDDFYFSYINFENNKLEFNNIYQYNYYDKIQYIPNFTSYDNQIIFHKGANRQYFFPIEEDRKAYYNSVVNIQPPSFWTFPPYPNPVKDKLKMRFYSAIMNQISNLKVELIEIGSGRIYQINEFNVIKNDDYYGVIDIDISNYNSGPYLINFRIGEANKSEAVLIE